MAKSTGPRPINKADTHMLWTGWGEGYKSNKVQAEFISLTELRSRFRTVVVSDIALADYHDGSADVRKKAKDGPWVCTTKFSGAKRLLKDAESSSGIWLDFDDGKYTRAEIVELVMPWTCFGFTSFSHTTTAPRYRFFLPYELPILPEQHKVAYKYWERLFPGLPNESGKPAQLWYTPRCPAGGEKEWWYWENDGAYFMPEEKTRKLRAVSSEGVDVAALTESIVVGDDGRHEAVNLLAAHFAATGVKQEVAEQLLIGLLCPASADTKTLAHIRDVPRSVEGAYKKYAPDPELLEAQQQWPQRYIFLQEQDKLYDVTTDSLTTPGAFDRANKIVQKKPLPHVWLLEQPETLRPANMTFHPGKAYGSITVEGKQLWNVYRPPIISVKAGDPALWLEHMTFLYPGHEEHILDWMAHVVQCPSVKINHGLGLFGRGRIGKDLICQPLVYGVGQAFTSTVSTDNLEEAYQDYLERKRLLMFNEILTDHRFASGRRIENKLKSLLAAPPDQFALRLLGRPGYTVPNLFAVVAQSNDIRPLQLSENSDRWYAAWSNAEQDKEKLSMLWDWMKADGAAICAGFLMDRDIKKFNPVSAPPQTVYAAEMIEGSKGHLELALEGMIEQPEGDWAKDLWRARDAATELHTGINVITDLFRRKEFLNRKARVKVDGRPLTVNLWAVRNIDEWEGKGPADWYSHWKETF